MDCTAEVLEKLHPAGRSVYETLQQVEDTRGKRGQRYALVMMLSIIVLGKLSGETELRGIAQWAQYRCESLCSAFGLTRMSMPHWTTLGRALRQINEQQMQSVLQASQRGESGQETQRIIDGKTLCGTIRSSASRGQHLLSVYAPDSRRVLAQATVAHKDNEITQAPHLLAQVSLQDKVVTGDAMFTQRRLSDQVCAAGGDYVWIVKENQPQLYASIARLFQSVSPQPGHGHLRTDFRSVCQTHKGHGRLERRCLTASSLLNTYLDWPHLQQVFRIERRRQRPDGSATTEVVYGVASLSPQAASPAALLGFVRRHWAIENQLHYVRDVSLREDACRLASPSAQIVMACLNNLVLSLLPFTPFHYLPDAQRFFNAHLDLALRMLF